MLQKVHQIKKYLDGSARDAELDLGAGLGYIYNHVILCQHQATNMIRKQH